MGRQEVIISQVHPLTLPTTSVLALTGRKSQPHRPSYISFCVYLSLFCLNSSQLCSPQSSSAISQSPARTSMASEVVMVDEISYPSKITTTKPLSLLGHGITDMEIHFLQVKFYSIGVYLEPEIVGHLQQWKGKPAKELEENDDFFDALISAPVEKFIRLVVIKEIKGAQYGVQIETAVRDRLAAEDKYEEEEEAALEKIVEFLQSKYFKKHSVITYYFPANSPTAEIVVSLEGKEDSKLVVENANVVEKIKKWYLGGTSAVSPSTISSLANTFSAELSK